jgi:hypothetical protein
MVYLGSTRGRGQLVMNGRNVGEFRYEIRGYQQSESKEFTGTLWGDPLTLQRGFEARELALVLKTGIQVPIVMARMSLGAGTGSIHVNAEVADVK